MLSFINCPECDTLSEINKDDVEYIWYGYEKNSYFKHRCHCKCCGKVLWIEELIDNHNAFIDFDISNPPPNFCGINYALIEHPEKFTYLTENYRGYYD